VAAPVKLVVAVLGARRSPYPRLIRTLKRTWAAARVEDVDVVFYYGGVEEVRRGADVFLRVPDDFAHIGDKTIALFEYLLAHDDFDLLFRTNSSSYVDLPNLRAWSDEHASATSH